MLDTEGPEVRTGHISEGKKFVLLKEGQLLKIVGDFGVEGTNEVVGCRLPNIHELVGKGD